MPGTRAFSLTVTIAVAGLIAAVAALAGCTRQPVRQSANSAESFADTTGTATAIGASSATSIIAVPTPGNSNPDASDASNASNADPAAIATVGALFNPDSSSTHTCTAAVVDSTEGNLIMTAAHCVSGQGTGMIFAPGYDDGRTPFGSWTVVDAYADPGWIASQDPHLDYAFLRVVPAAGNVTSRSVQSAVGGNALGATPAPGTPVTVAGYRLGQDDQPVICSTTVYSTDGFPSFECPGYVGGTSGGPWISGFDPARGAGTITGVIGGLHQGGCYDDTSYTSPFAAMAGQLLARASAGGASDVLPQPGPDGC